jgi:hypothetical protein
MSIRREKHRTNTLFTRPRCGDVMRSLGPQFVFSQSIELNTVREIENMQHHSKPYLPMSLPHHFSGRAA